MVFYDLNVPASLSIAERVSILNKLKSLGYDGVAWNSKVHSAKLSINDFVEITHISPQQEDSSISSTSWRLENTTTSNKNQSTSISQYSRITMIFDDLSFIHQWGQVSSVLARYDLIAIQPTNDKVFYQCCSSVDLDIITLDCSSHIPFSLKPAIVKQAVDRGVCFEISYSGCLKEGAAKKNFFNNSMNIIRLTKGKNIIFTSEARNALSVRGIYDIMNLACLLGFEYDLAKSILSSNCASLLLRGQTRATMKGVIKFNTTLTHSIPSSLTQPVQTSTRKERKALEHQEYLAKQAALAANNNNNNNNENNQMDVDTNNSVENNTTNTMTASTTTTNEMNENKQEQSSKNRIEFEENNDFISFGKMDEDDENEMEDGVDEKDQMIDEMAKSLSGRGKISENKDNKKQTQQGQKQNQQKQQNNSPKKDQKQQQQGKQQKQQQQQQKPQQPPTIQKQNSKEKANDATKKRKLGDNT